MTTRSYATFINVITNDGRQAKIRRGTNDRNESQFDGLWTCRLNGATGAGAFYVGIYDTPPTSKINFFARLNLFNTVSAVVIIHFLNMIKG